MKKTKKKVSDMWKKRDKQNKKYEENVMGDYKKSKKRREQNVREKKKSDLKE